MIMALKDINKIIEETREQVGGEVLELDFSSVKIFRFTQKIKALIEKCTNLAVLKLVECQLNSLQKLPDLDITGIDASMNKLKDSDVEYLTKYKNLSMLNLSDNFIASFDSIKKLKACTKLKDLELAGNQIQKLPNYRQQIFKELKSLQYLDKLDKDGLPPPYESHSDDIISQLEQDQDDSGSYQDQDYQSQEGSDQFGQESQNLNLEQKRKYPKRQ